MIFAKINKSDDIVTHLTSHTSSPRSGDLFYEIEITDLKSTFPKSIRSTQFKYIAPNFVDQGPRLEGRKRGINENLLAYVAKLSELGFSGDPYSVSDITDWLAGLTYDATTLPKIFQAVIYAMTALGYGWRIDPDA